MAQFGALRGFHFTLYIITIKFADSKERASPTKLLAP